MKKKYLTLGLLTASICAAAQKTPKDTSLYKKQKLSETDIQVAFSYYIQDGSHSAVTGGRGTEELTVYAPEATITHRRDSIHTFTLNAGADIITSASTDNIDYILSTASRVDIRSHVNLAYSRRLGHSTFGQASAPAFPSSLIILPFPPGLTLPIPIPMACGN